MEKLVRCPQGVPFITDYYSQMNNEGRYFIHVISIENPFIMTSPDGDKSWISGKRKHIEVTERLRFEARIRCRGCVNYVKGCTITPHGNIVARKS